MSHPVSLSQSEMIDKIVELEERIRTLIQRSDDMKKVHRVQLLSGASRNKALLGILDEAIIIADKTGKILDATDPAVRLFEVRGLRLEGKEISSLFWGEELDNLKMFIKVNVSSPVTNKNFRLYLAESQVSVKYDISLNAVIAGDAGLVEYIVLIRERDVLTANVPPSINNSTLSSEIAEIQQKFETLKKDKDKLAVSEKKLKDLNNRKDRFFSILAHDLRGPFMALLGFSQYLEHEINDLTPQEIREFSSNINKSARNVFTLLENLLQWSRLQLGKLEFNPVEFNLFELVEQNCRLYSSIALAKKITIYNQVSQPVKVQADKNMIDFVIRNLISNSIKFSNQRGAIKINVYEKEGFAEITVEDDGVGMSRENLSKLFRIDVQFTTEGTDHETGFGLGLVLCNDFVLKNGGRIRAESEQGKGSRFIFSVPLAHQIELF